MLENSLDFKLQENYDAAEKMMLNPWWEEQYKDLFTEDFEVDLPFAPPGMDQHLGVGQLLPHKEWMCRTVKNWKVTNLKIFGPRDPFDETFFAIRYVSADTFWGAREGKFESRQTTLLRIKNGKIKYMKEWFNPLKYLMAAGLEIPVFHQDFDRENVKERETFTLEDMNLDLSDEASTKRAYDNVTSFITLDSFASAKKRIQSPDFRHAVWNAPYEMKEEYPVEDFAVFDDWIGKSLSKGWNGHPDMICYATDDPHVYFLEAGGYGIAEWVGNNASGGYGNRYIKYIEIDDNGLLKRWDENLNPISKFNSINVSLPSFPYLY